MPLPQLTPLTATLGVVAAVWAGVTVGLVAHTVTGTAHAPLPRAGTTYRVSPPPSAQAAAAGSLPVRVERVLTGRAARTTQAVTGSSPAPVASAAASAPAAAVSSAPSAAPSASAASASPSPSAEPPSPSPSPAAPSASPSSTRHGRVR